MTPSPVARLARATALATALAAGLVPTLATQAAAGELLVSVGADRLRSVAGYALGVEGRLSPFWEGSVFGRPLSLGLGAAIEFDDDRDGWGGAGLVLLAPLGPNWRLEATVMPGVYAEGLGEDLGTRAPVFRTTLGASRALSGPWRIGAAIGHKSNAGTAMPNPGVETLLVSLHRAF